MKNKNYNKGAMIVEAILVLPLVFAVVFMLVYVGNLMVIRSNIESKVVEKAIEGSNSSVDPVLHYYNQNGSLPGFESLAIKPYRYLLSGNGKDVANYLKDELEKEIGNNSSVFDVMNPIVESVDVEYKNYFIAATFKVNVVYKINIPWLSIVGNNYSPTFNIQIAIPVNDTSELIRNTDMVIDYMTKFGVTDKIASLFSKVKSLMNINKSK